MTTFFRTFRALIGGPLRSLLSLSSELPSSPWIDGLLESGLDAAWMVTRGPAPDRGPHFRIVAANRRLHDLLGVDHGRLVGVTLAEVPALAGMAALAQDFAACLAGGAPQETERTLAAGGAARVILERAVPAGPAGLVITWRDLTDQRAIEAVVRRQSAFQQMMVDAIPVPLFVKDGDGRYDVCNQAFARFIGRPLDELIGRTVFDIVPADLADTFHKADLALMETGGIQTYEGQVQTQSGNRRDVVFTKALYPAAGDRNGIIGVIQDITDRKQALARMRQSEIKFNKAFQASPEVMTLSLLTERRLLDVNEAFQRQLGYDRAEAVGQTMTALGIWADQAEQERVLTKLAETGSVRNVEAQWRRRDGVVLPVLFSAELVEIDGDQVVISMIRDIAGWRDLNRKLESALREQQLIFEHATVGIVFLRDRWVERANRRAAELLGFDRPEDMRGRSAREFYFNDAVFRSIGETAYPLMAKGGVFRTEVNLRRRDDGQICVSMLGRAVAPGMADEGVIWIIEDITARRQAEAAVRASEEKFRQLMQQASDGLFFYTLEGRFIDVNRYACDLVGYAREDLLSMTVFDLLRDLDGEQSVGLLARRDNALPTTVQGTIARRDGTTVPVELRVGRVRIGAENFILAVARDVSERRRIEAELLKAKEAAEAANKAKSDFLARMSHELRTPLNAIIGFSELMRSMIFGPLGHANYAGYADDIHASGHHLLKIINDILDLSKLQSGKQQLAEEWTEVLDIVQPCLEMVSLQAKEKQLTIRHHLPPERIELWADRRSAHQVIINLLSNAVKFTPDGGRIVITVTAAPGSMLSVVVADTGIGIAAVDIPTILEPFGQIDHPLSRRHRGTGLGLPLAKSLVELHGGTLAIASEPGDGTAVCVTFPIWRAISQEPSS